MIGLLLPVATFVAFALERRPSVVIAVSASVLMMGLGFLNSGQMLHVFRSLVPITICAMFVLSGALLQTGVMQEVAGWVIRTAASQPIRNDGHQGRSS